MPISSEWSLHFRSATNSLYALLIATSTTHLILLGLITQVSCIMNLLNCVKMLQRLVRYEIIYSYIYKKD
jgi:hypothetical protein